MCYGRLQLVALTGTYGMTLLASSDTEVEVVGEECAEGMGTGEGCSLPQIRGSRAERSPAELERSAASRGRSPREVEVPRRRRLTTRGERRRAESGAIDPRSWARAWTR